MYLVPAHHYTDDDLCNTIRELGGMWDELAARGEIGTLHHRYRYALGATLARAGLPAPGDEADLAISLRAAWNHDVRAAAEEIVNDAIGALYDAGRAIQHGAGRIATQHGSVAQLSTSTGGVPKQPIERAQIGSRGIAGDRQAARVHHGRPWQALCLWSADVIERLQAEGHPIGFGAAGENVTIRGIDWCCVLPGTVMRIGTAVVHVSTPATPCRKNAQWFLAGDFTRMNVQREVGVTRMYASVLAEGEASVGDPVVLEPPD